MQDIDRQGSKNVLVMHSFFWLGSVAILAGSFFGAVPWIDSNRLPASMFPPPAELPLGAEYFQIGKAISEGRGFSSPFRVPSGPTAWMPPAIPVLLSGLFLPPIETNSGPRFSFTVSERCVSLAAGFRSFGLQPRQVSP